MRVREGERGRGRERRQGRGFISCRKMISFFTRNGGVRRLLKRKDSDAGERGNSSLRR